MARDDARSLAYETILKCTKNGSYSNIEINNVIKRSSLPQCDRGLYTALVYGTLEKLVTLDHVINSLSNMPCDKISEDVRCTLRLGIYQILFLDRVPDFAAVDESVKIIKRSKNGRAASFVNGVLRNAIRKKDSIMSGIMSADLDVRYSFPKWICDIYIASYGREKAESILRSMECRSPLTLRVNTLKISVAAFARELERRDIKYRISDMTEDVLEIEKGSPDEIYGFDKGLFFVQGTGSALAVKTLSPCENDTVIDTCACPGGQSFDCGILMKNKGKIYSLDIHENKLSLVRRTAERLGITIIDTAYHNALVPSTALFATADKVICDVPCSGLGMCGKKPDIKMKSPDDIERLYEIQPEIIKRSASYLKVGGRLMYSTCTLNKRENEDVTNAFLREHPNFSRLEGCPFTAFPDEGFDEGFFFDILQKESE